MPTQRRSQSWHSASSNSIVSALPRPATIATWSYSAWRCAHPPWKRATKPKTLSHNFKMNVKNITNQYYESYSNLRELQLYLNDQIVPIKNIYNAEYINRPESNIIWAIIRINSHWKTCWIFKNIRYSLLNIQYSICKYAKFLKNKDIFNIWNLSICRNKNGSAELYEALEKILWWFIEIANILNICKS